MLQYYWFVWEFCKKQLAYLVHLNHTNKNKKKTKFWRYWKNLKYFIIGWVCMYIFGIRFWKHSAVYRKIINKIIFTLVSWYSLYINKINYRPRTKSILIESVFNNPLCRVMIQLWLKSKYTLYQSRQQNFMTIPIWYIYICTVM